MAGQVTYMSLTCEHSNVMNLAVNLTSNCNKNCFCDGVAYSPVCSVKTGVTFFSPCHAACNQWDNEKKIYSGCSCASESLDASGNSTISLRPTFEDYAPINKEILLTTTATSFTAAPPSIFPAISSTNFYSEMPFDDEISQYVDEDDEVKQQTGRRKRKDNNNEQDDNLLENIMTPGIFQPQHQILVLHKICLYYRTVLSRMCKCILSLYLHHVCCKLVRLHRPNWQYSSNFPVRIHCVSMKIRSLNH